MHRRENRFRSLLTVVLLLATAAPTFAQSGRGRTSTPPHAPKPKPNAPVTTVLGIPEGGKLVRQGIDGSTATYVLKNGLTLIIRERHSSPLVAVSVSVKAGSYSDQTGMAEVTRQAILRGTAKRNAMAMEREIARLGGQFASATSFDQTGFNLIAPAESYPAMIELLADLITRPAFNAEDVKTAAALAALTDKRARDEAQTNAWRGLLATIFPANAPKIADTPAPPVAGQVTATPAAIAQTTPTREQVLAFYQAFYHPQNTVIAIVGDIFMLQALGQVQLQFGNFAKAATAAAPTATANAAEAAPGKLNYANARIDASQSRVFIGYRTPALKNDKESLKEAAVLQMLAAVLGQGRASRLFQGLREGQASRDKQSVASGAQAEFVALPNAGILLAELTVDPDRIDRAEAEYFREIERFRRELISEGELQRARALLEKEHIDNISQYETEAALIGATQARFGDYRLLDSNLARLRAVTAQELQATAAKYLSLTNTSVYELEARRAPARNFTPEKFAELVVTFDARAAQAVRPEDVKPGVVLKTFTQGAERTVNSDAQNVIVATPPVPLKDFSVLRGPLAYVREDRSQPRLAVGVFFQGGRLVEDQTTSGMTELMLRSLLKSTTTRKADLIAQEIESYGGELRIVNEPDMFGFTLDVLSRNAEPAVRVLLEVIESPFFDKVEVARERDLLLAEQLAARDDDARRAEELMLASVFPGHPYGLPRYGLPDAIKTANEEKVEAWYTRSVKKQLPLVLLVGDTDGSALVSRIFSEGLKRGELDKTLKVNLPGLTAPPEEQAETHARLLTTQAYGLRLPAPTPGQTTGTANAASQVNPWALDMAAALADSGKLVEELRDKTGATDRIDFAFERRLAAWLFHTNLATLPEDEARARAAIQAELQRLATTVPSDDEFEAARNATIGRYAIALQSHARRMLEYAEAVVAGRKPTEVEAQPDLLRDLKKADIKRAAETALKTTAIGRGTVRGAKN